MGAMTVRLDPDTTAILEQLVRETGQTKSEIVREALRKHARRNGRKVQKGETLYDRIKHVIGTCDSGGMDLSVDTGRKYTEMLWEDRRAKLARGRGSTHRARRSK
jgi:Arc/MetJ-type ribon-helix-helix transcriptional regulator